MKNARTLQEFNELKKSYNNIITFRIYFESSRDGKSCKALGVAITSDLSVGCVAQWAERRSLAGELTLSCARPAADG